MKVELKGDTPEKKFKHLERIIERMSRRLQKTVIGLVPVSPIFGYLDNLSNGCEVARMIFPAEGIITKVASRVSACGKNARIHINILSRDNQEQGATFPLKAKVFVQDIDFPIKAGDALSLWISDEEDENSAKGTAGIWIGFLYQVGMRDLAKTKIAIEQFEQLTGDFDASDEEGS